MTPRTLEVDIATTSQAHDANEFSDDETAAANLIAFARSNDYTIKHVTVKSLSGWAGDIATDATNSGPNVHMTGRGFVTHVALLQVAQEERYPIDVSHVTPAKLDELIRQGDSTPHEPLGIDYSAVVETASSTEPVPSASAKPSHLDAALLAAEGTFGGIATTVGALTGKLVGETDIVTGWISTSAGKTRSEEPNRHSYNQHIAVFTEAACV